MVYKIKRIETWKIKPIKYLDNRFFILEYDFSKWASPPLGTIVYKALWSKSLSFIKKNEINKTEKNPIVKLPNADTKPFNKLGMCLNSISSK